MIGGLLSNQPFTPAPNIPGSGGSTPNTSAGFDPIPPGIGRLNYLQTVLTSTTTQDLYITSTPTFVSAILTGLTATQLVGTDASKTLISVAPGVSLSYSGTTLNTIQNIRTSDSPTFTGMNLSGLTPLRAVFTDPSSFLISAPDYFDQAVKVASSPTFAQLTVSQAGGATLALRNSNAAPVANTLIGHLSGYINDGAQYQIGASIKFYTDAATGNGDVPGRIGFYTVPDGSATLAERMRITNAGLVGIGCTPANSHTVDIYVPSGSGDPVVAVGKDQTNLFGTLGFADGLNALYLQGGVWGGVTRPLVLQGGGGDVYTEAWTDWSSSVQCYGWSAYTTKLFYYKKIGKMMFVEYYIDGTSSQTYANISLPHTKSIGVIQLPIRATNSGTNITGLSVIVSFTAQIDFYSTMGGQVWTASGGKMVTGQFWVECTA